MIIYPAPKWYWEMGYRLSQGVLWGMTSGLLQGSIPIFPAEREELRPGTNRCGLG